MTNIDTLFSFALNKLTVDRERLNSLLEKQKGTDIGRSMTEKFSIGDLYLVKKYFWLLFSTKAVAADCRGHAADRRGHAADAGEAAAYLSRRYDCEVTYFSPDSIIIFLENDGKFKKVLTSDGKIGWIWFAEEYYNDCFEELKAEP